MKLSISTIWTYMSFPMSHEVIIMVLFVHVSEHNLLYFCYFEFCRFSF
jgi:hypothetical protein